MTTSANGKIKESFTAQQPMVTTLLPSEGIELLHTADCTNWQETLANLKQALAELKIKDEPRVIKLDTMEQAQFYNFFASPTIHVNGIDIDRTGRRTGKRGLGQGRPYWYKKQASLVPPVELIKQGLAELYLKGIA